MLKMNSHTKFIVKNWTFVFELETPDDITSFDKNDFKG